MEASDHAEPLVPPAPGLDGSIATAPRLAYRRATIALRSARFAIAVYLATRVLLMLVAFVNGSLRHHAFTHELAQWDGLWYRALANHGYPDHVLHVQSTLGFFPLYPMVLWLGSHAFVVPIARWEILSTTVAGVIVSGLGGLLAAVLVGRLAERWWGEQAARRAVLLFCLFPGSVVFSMVYAEGIIDPARSRLPARAAEPALAARRRAGRPGNRHRAPGAGVDPGLRRVGAARGAPHARLGVHWSRRPCRSSARRRSPSSCGSGPAARSPA